MPRPTFLNLIIRNQLRAAILGGLLLQLVVHPAVRAEPRAAANPSSNKPPVRVTISKETTYITEPLRPDGYPDYIRYLNKKLSEGVTPENNAAVFYIRAFSLGENGKDDGSVNCRDNECVLAIRFHPSWSHFPLAP